jgi:hypothetical protein
MTSRLRASSLGALAGTILALFDIEVMGIDRFALTAGRTWAGYLELTLLGAVIASLSGASLAPPRRVVLGGALGLAFAYALRLCDAPWVNLYAVGAGGGPAGELPLLILPSCGALLACGFFCRRGA